MVLASRSHTDISLTDTSIEANYFCTESSTHKHSLTISHTETPPLYNTDIFPKQTPLKQRDIFPKPLKQRDMSQVQSYY
jgi:hypothetical protein